MKIVVLAGGLSPERNVSLSTGCMVAEALRGRGHRVALVDMFFGVAEGGDLEALFDRDIPEAFKHVSREAPDLEQVRASRPGGGRSLFGPRVLELCGGADLVFLALHGACGEDGRVQAALDLMGIPYTGSGHLASAIAMDKDLTKRLAAQAGIATSPWRILTYTRSDIPALSQELELPCVVKPMDGGSSIGVAIAHTPQELSDALEQDLAFGGPVLVERYLQGREIQVGVLEDRALPSIEIIPKQGFYDYENKYQPGAAEEVCPAPVDPELERRLGETALAVHRLLGLAVYSRTDFIVDGEGTPWLLESNTLPGMTPTSLLPQEAAAVGIGYPELCERILTASLEARRAGR